MWKVRSGTQVHRGQLKSHRERQSELKKREMEQVEANWNIRRSKVESSV